jgi:hypothetical protein
MKKLALGAIVLLAFNGAIILTQMSCQKEASAQSGGTTESNLVLFYKVNSQEIWLSNIDGSNQHRIPITLPSGLKPGEGRLTSNGKSVVFEAFTESTGENAGIYTCLINGSNVKVVVDKSNEEILLQDVK